MLRFRWIAVVGDLPSAVGGGVVRSEKGMLTQRQGVTHWKLSFWLSVCYFVGN